MASQQREAVDNVLAELDVNHIPLLCVWNKVTTVASTLN
jgi:50S ribosomal subunit-associated GTPase HflX